MQTGHADDQHHNRLTQPQKLSRDACSWKQIDNVSDESRSHAHPPVDVGTVAPEHDFAHPFAPAVVDMIADRDPVFVHGSFTERIHTGNCRPNAPGATDALADDSAEMPDVVHGTDNAMDGKAHSDKSVQTRKEFLRAMQQVRIPKVRPWPMPTVLPSKTVEGGQSHKRSLLGDMPDPTEMYDEMKEIAEEVANAVVDNFENVLCQTMHCSLYCPSRDCDSNSNLGECFKGFGAFIVRNLFACSNDQTIDDCVINRLMYGFVELLDQLLDWILMLIDTFGQGTAKMLF